MKIPKGKTLRFQIFFVSALLVCILVVLLGISIKRSFEERKHSEEYVIKSKIAGILNTVAGWQAIERGYGATIIGSGEGSSSPLFSRFLEMAEKGDSEVLQIEENAKELLSVSKDKTFEERLNRWRKGYKTFTLARPRIANSSISRDEWFRTATININNEFDLRNVTFAPERMGEKILYLNNVLRPNIARLCEYAGRERALVGNTIATGKPFSNETINRIKENRSIVELSLGQILLLKDLPSTSYQIKQAIDEFEKEFLVSYQLLREEVFFSSKKQADEVKASSARITERKVSFRKYLFGITSDLLNMSRHKSIIALTKALMAEEDIHLSERMSAVEDLFNSYSQVKRVYDQVRFLDNSGYERVRVDFDGNDTTIIGSTQLQDKSSRYYFKEAINLPPGEIFISPLDLNIEHGRVEIPYKPVMRFAAPVFVDGKQAGIIVFNLVVNMPIFLHKSTEKGEKEDYFLADQDGFYLHHPDEVKEWGMMEMLDKSHHNIRQDYPDVAGQILSGKGGSVRLISGEVIVYEPFFLNLGVNTSKFWVIINRVESMEYPVNAVNWFDRATKAINSGLALSNIAGEDANTVMLELQSTVKRKMYISYIIIGSSVFVFIFFIRWSRNRILKPIQKLTAVTQRIAGGNFSLKAEVKSRDEIGVLATNFNKMAAELTNEIINHKQSEEKLLESEEHYRTLAKLSPVGIFHTDSEGHCLYVNERWCEITGLAMEEAKREGWARALHPDDRDRIFTEWYQAAKSKSIFKSEYRFLRSDGEAKWVFGQAEPEVVANGEVIGYVGTITDITERKKIEEILLQSEKLRAMGIMTSGVAHDFNNILAVISGNAQLMERNYGDHKEMMDGFHIIRKAVSDGAEIVRRMRKFTKVERDTSEFMSVDIKNILEQAIEFSRPRWMNMAKARGITYDIDKKGLKKVPAVLGSPPELREVFVNIINNAMDAMTGGGCISFRTWHRSGESRGSSARRSLLGRGTLSKEDTVFVSISDTGEGMTEEVRKRIFDPFFTTKRAEGSGLGMSVAYGVIAGHGGKIEVESEVGKGATFTMSIPITRETLQQAVSPEPHRKIKGDKLRILVVDDEEKICSMLNKYFSRDGHDVKSVNNGTEAIKLLKNEEFDLVLCDLVLPDISGHDIVKVIGELDKRPKVGLITGWDEKIETRGREELKVDFISRKPFDFSKLTSHINEALGAG